LLFTLHILRMRVMLIQDFTFLNINLTICYDVNTVYSKFNFWHHHEQLVGSGPYFAYGGESG